ncbi:bidirectional sugar transporter SWEET15-like [Chenopodium quinoa]|uniref:bidirectional sugar transporter SWEET15-like n=1 Tax=Chenopodium quinoa TaxID=63459 RepID=UPI000B76D658|nr:bidirectional sugar transporter SWEET15-like [Chenopodium quinoa]
MALHTSTLSLTIVGILGNMISGLVYLAPLPTYYKIYKKKSTEGFQSVPYVAALFSAMLWLYYALLKKKEYFLISINSVGCIIETLYIAFYYAYASRRARIFTGTLVLSLNLVIFSMIVLIIQLKLGEGTDRVKVLGIICAIVSIGVFAAPLTIMVKVIRTKSVEYMPFFLSFCLTLCAIIWFAYGLLRQDLYVSIPNIFGFALGVLQMVLYAICKNCCIPRESVDQRISSNRTNLVNGNVTTTDQQDRSNEPQTELSTADPAV